MPLYFIYIGLVVGVGLALALNSFYVMAEYALIKVRRGQLEDLMEEGHAQAERVLGILDETDSYLSTIQLGITASSLFLGIFGVTLLQHLLAGFMNPWLAFAVAFAIIAFLHIIFGELLPRAVAMNNVESVAMGIVYPLMISRYVFYPFVLVATKAFQTIQRIFGIAKPKEDIARSEDELRQIVSASEDAGELDSMESRMIDNVFDFADRVAREVMLPRQDMICLYTDDLLKENLDTVRSSRHTRYPLCEEDKDHVIGTVHVRDLLDLNTNTEVDLRKVMRPIFVVPEAMPTSKVLQMMQQKHVQMVLVADEYGGTAGLITMEDLVEEIVGEIQDEHEANEPDPIIPLDNGAYEFDGMVLLDELVEIINIEFDDPEEDTIGGYVFGLLGRKPELGDTVTIDGWSFVVLAAEGFRVLRVKAVPLPAKVAEEDED